MRPAVDLCPICLLLILAFLALPACGAANEDDPRVVPTTTDRAMPEADSSGHKSPETVRLFYATDRAHFAPDMGWYLMRFVWAALALVVGWLVIRSGRKIIAPPYQWRVTVFKVLVWLLVLGLAAYAAYDCVRMIQRGGRLSLQYGGSRGRYGAEGGLPLELGDLSVSVPPHHVEGRIEKPTLWKADFFEDPNKHMVLTAVTPLAEEEFFEELSANVEDEALKKSGPDGQEVPGQLFVFIHGFNNTFEDAALRTGQIFYDLKKRYDYCGAPVLYSWPSGGTVPEYLADGANAGWTVPHLHAFLLALRERSGAEKIHLIAHSMGNRALTAALRRMRDAEVRAHGAEKEFFDQIVLAAPDIDADTFREDIAPAVRSTGRVTLYASAKDHALELSKRFHGAPRAGDAGQDGAGIIVADGIETVDVTAVTGSHSYIGDSGWVLEDLSTLLEGRQHLHARTRTAGEGTYLVLHDPPDE